MLVLPWVSPAIVASRILEPFKNILCLLVPDINSVLYTGLYIEPQGKVWITEQSWYSR